MPPNEGAIIKNFVSPNEVGIPSKELVIYFFGESLVNYKIPVEVEFRAELPTIPIGKIEKSSHEPGTI